MKNVAIALALGLTVSMFSVACDEGEEVAPEETTDFDTPPAEQAEEPLAEPEPALEVEPATEEAVEGEPGLEAEEVEPEAE